MNDSFVCTSVKADEANGRIGALESWKIMRQMWDCYGLLAIVCQGEGGWHFSYNRMNDC